jgi:hypothetical protein
MTTIVVNKWTFRGGEYVTLKPGDRVRLGPACYVLLSMGPVVRGVGLDTQRECQARRVPA